MIDPKTGEITVADKRPLAQSVHEWSQAEVQLIKDTVAQGTTDNELKLFLYTAQQTGLNPLLRQVHAVKRWNSALGREAMAIQTGIDGYRLIAERTGKYAPGKEPSYEEKDGKLYSATAYVKKFVKGEWHEVAATAFWDEYVQKKKDGTANSMWARMPKLMLAKVAESLVLRKAFPAEMAEVYTDEEMNQADTVEAAPIKAPTRAATVMPQKKAEVVETEETPLAPEKPPLDVEPEDTAQTVEMVPTRVTPVKLDGPGYRYEIEGIPGVGVLHTANKAIAQSAKNAMDQNRQVTFRYRNVNGEQHILGVE